MPRPIVLVDISNVFIRNYIVNPQMDQNGIVIGGAIGSLKTLGALSKKLMPKKIIIVWETGGSPKRLKLFPEYKQQRKPLKTNREFGEDISDSKENENYQKRILIDLLSHLPVYQIHVENAEADDVIAYLCKSIYPDEEKIIVSSDQDFYQLLDDKTKMYRPGKKVFVKPKDIINEHKISPKNFVVAKALNGDPSDNIPGIERVGFKSLAKRFEMIHNDVSLDDILEESKKRTKEDKKPLVMYKNIVKGEEIARRNLELMKLDNKLLSTDQVQMVNRIIKEFIPTYNKIKFWSTYLDLKLDGLDVDRICQCFQFLIYSNKK